MSFPDLSTAAPPFQVPSEASKHIFPWLVAFAFFMESLDTTNLNTAAPAISEALNVTPLSMKAVLASYTLSLAVFIPISGWVANGLERAGRFAAAIAFLPSALSLWNLEQHSSCSLPAVILQGCGGVNDVPVGRLTLVRTFAKSDCCEQ